MQLIKQTLKYGLTYSKRQFTLSDNFILVIREDNFARKVIGLTIALLYLWIAHMIFRSEDLA